MLRVKMLSENGRVPERGSRDAAGYDLFSAEEYRVGPCGKCLMKTDIAVAIPKGYYGRIAPRSSMAWKFHTDVGAGVVDSDYRGNVGVVMFNHGQEELVVKKHDKIAQLILEKIITPEIVIVDDLDETERGEGGFGSTGQ